MHALQEPVDHSEIDDSPLFDMRDQEVLADYWGDAMNCCIIIIADTVIMTRFLSSPYEGHPK
eukprot:8250792-Ditylum_brightwellii.AAC.1